MFTEGVFYSSDDGLRQAETSGLQNLYCQVVFYYILGNIYYRESSTIQSELFFLELKSKQKMYAL